MINKPIILFTNFWDANKLLEKRHFLFWKDEKLFNVHLTSTPRRNYSIQSIALSHPPLNRLGNIEKEFHTMNRLSFFCPTYEMLSDIKRGGSWEDYVKQFYPLMKKRKGEVVEWIESLMPDKIYMLCCWENTSKGAHCHRQLLYEAFSKSKTMNDKAIYVYRDGGWDDDSVETTELYAYMSALSKNVKKYSNLPVIINSQTLSDELGIPIGTPIGTAMTSQTGDWTVKLQSGVSDVFSKYIHGNNQNNMSMGCSFPTTEEK